MGNRSSTIIAGISGVIWIAFVALVASLTNELALPAWEADRGEILGFYSASAYDMPFVVGIALAVLVWLPLLVFIAKLADILSAADGQTRWVGHLILAGAILQATFHTAYYTTLAAGVFWASHGGLADDALLALHGLAHALLAVSVLPAIVWVLPAAVAIIVSGLFPRLLGGLMLAVGAALLVSFVTGLAGWAASLPPLMIAVLAVWMLLHLDRYSASRDMR